MDGISAVTARIGEIRALLHPAPAVPPRAAAPSASSLPSAAGARPSTAGPSFADALARAGAPADEVLHERRHVPLGHPGQPAELQGVPDHVVGHRHLADDLLELQHLLAVEHVLELDRAVSEQPVEIADASGPEGTPSRIIGWGVTCPVRGCGEPPAQLQELDTEVVADSQCSLSLIDGATEICTGSSEPNANACFGDSGGPQLEGQPGDWKLTGVTSRLGSLVPVCGTAPSVYTDATAYKDWIAETTG